MKKNTLGDLQTSDVSSVGILDTRELPQKYITLDELVSEVLPLLSRYAPNIIEEIQAFTDLDVKDLKGSMKPLKNPYYKSLNKSLRLEGNGNKLTKFATRNLSLRS